MLKRLKAALSGMPPPPDRTWPRQKVEDILDVLRKMETIQNDENEKEIHSSMLKINCSLPDVVEYKWPEAKSCSFFDISYNLNNLSEKLVELYDKYRERYVGCETSSFITSNSPTKDHLALKKDRRKMYGYSPGRRLSHLARRRTAFSSESLLAASNAKTWGAEKKTILVDPRNKKEKQVKRALFHSDDEIKNKKTDFRSFPSTSKLKSFQLKHSLWLRKRTPKKGTPRKTPSKQTPRKLTPKKHDTSRKCDMPQKSLKMFTCQAYQTSKTENGKRLKLEIDACEALKNQSNGENVFELSDMQRRKLLWAVSSALKKFGINDTSKHFRACGKRLYRICKQFWTSSSSSRTLKYGISESMLSLATEHVENVIKEIRNSENENVELFSQDSNSCDVFFLNNSTAND